MKNNIIKFITKEGIVMCTILERIKNKTAIELLQEYNIKLSPPIDLASLLENIGISVIAKDFTEIEQKCGYGKGTIMGVTLSKGDDLAIFYNKNDTYHRKIFTIAHELGHCCKHSDNLKISHIELRTSMTDLDEYEKDANIFAGELLIPKDVLEATYKKFIFPSLKALSDIFGVSTNVMAARLDYLGLDYFKDTKLSEE